MCVPWRRPTMSRRMLLLRISIHVADDRRELVFAVPSLANQSLSSLTHLRCRLAVSIQAFDTLGDTASCFKPAENSDAVIGNEPSPCGSIAGNDWKTARHVLECFVRSPSHEP